MTAVTFLAFFAGGLIGLVVRSERLAASCQAIAVAASSLIMLLFGIQATGSVELRATLPGDLVMALLMAAAAVVGSALAVAAVVRTASPSGDGRQELDPNDDRLSARVALTAPFVLVGVGAAVGPSWRPPWLESATAGLLQALVLTIGLQVAQLIREQRTQHSGLGLSREAVRILLLVPVGVIGGSLAVGGLAGVAVGLGWKVGLLCAAPLGWQTLGGPMVLELEGARLGNLVFLCNLARDGVALVSIPLVGRGRWRLLALAPGGVSTMDVLLPTVIAVGGRQQLLYAVWVGACCSFWAPILVGGISRLL